jgi:hypothetical protein
VFKFTPDINYYLSDVEIVRGGSGYSLDNCLSEEIENIYPIIPC